MKLAKLILMLSSENDGEVVAAARAIGRKLKADGKDWYWLADRLEDKMPNFIKSTHEEMADFIMANGASFIRQKDYQFAHDVRHQRYPPTPKQWKYLNDLYENVKRRKG